MNFFDDHWGGLTWSSWIHFEAPDYSDDHFTHPGVYRVRKKGGSELFYIGQTGRTLKKRLQELISQTNQQEMPYNDPHTAAPSLWAWKDAEHIQFEASVAAVECAENDRKALECYLLWIYRLEKGESTLCNFGRFHPLYAKSSNKSKGFRGGRLPEGQVNPNGKRSFPPASFSEPGKPCDRQWMGLTWSEFLPLISMRKEKTYVPEVPGVYRISASDEQQLIYIGESMNLKTRLLDHARHLAQRADFRFSCYTYFPANLREFELREVENDLIGGYYHLTGKTPRLQFSNYQQEQGFSEEDPTNEAL